jgi:hypothetical protein
MHAPQRLEPLRHDEMPLKDKQKQYENIEDEQAIFRIYPSLSSHGRMIQIDSMEIDGTQHQPERVSHRKARTANKDRFLANGSFTFHGCRGITR